MVLVALVAVGGWGWRLVNLQEKYRDRVKTLAANILFLDTVGRLYSVRAERLDGEVLDFRDEAARCARISAHYTRLKLKYERAARYPWLPVEPDPPEPE
jgi:hypothetical protein